MLKEFQDRNNGEKRKVVFCLRHRRLDAASESPGVIQCNFWHSCSIKVIEKMDIL